MSFRLATPAELDRLLKLAPVTDDREAELEQRADELARLFVTTIFPDLYADNPNCFVPNIYNRMARIAIQAIGEGIV